MAKITLAGTAVSTVGELPSVGSKAPAFSLSSEELGEITGPEGRAVLNIFPSIDTYVCAASVRRFNELAAEIDGASVICVSMDLPFAMNRFCGAEGLDNVMVASGFRSTFGDDYGVTMADGMMRGLLARAVVVIDADGTVVHAELVSEIGSEPDYQAAVEALR